MFAKRVQEEFRVFVAPVAFGEAHRGRWFDVGSEPGWCEAAFEAIRIEAGVEEVEVIDFDGNLDQAFTRALNCHSAQDIEEGFALVQEHGAIFLAACKLEDSIECAKEALERFVDWAVDERSLAEQILNEQGLLDGASDFLKMYFDTEAWWRDTKIESYQVVSFADGYYAFHRA
jgi:antirestriction protein